MMNDAALESLLWKNDELCRPRKPLWENDEFGGREVEPGMEPYTGSGKGQSQQAPRWSLVWLEKCQPIVLRLSHARIRLSGRDMPISLHHALKMTRGTSCSLPSGSTMESTGVCCSSVAMLCEWRTEAAQAANGLA